MQLRNPGIVSLALFLISLSGWFLMHLFFVSADPGMHIGPSRDAWTDEGLYTAQARNYIHHDAFNLEENPAFFKTPLYNVILVPFFYIFGTQLETARLVILCFTILTFLFLARKKPDRIFYVIVLYTAFCNLFVFTYAHLAMAEMMGILFIIIGIHYLSRWPVADSLMSRIRMILIVQVWIGLAFLSKAMYVYMLAFVPAVMLAWSVIRGLQKSSKPRQLLSFAAISIMAVLLFVMVYWIIWIIPNNTLATHIWQYEGISRFAAIEDMPGTIRFWIGHIYFDSLHAFHTGMFLAVSLLFIVLIILKKIRPGWTGFLWLTWFVFELYKLVLMDQPPRYQVSLLVSMGCLVAYMIRNIQSSENRWIKLLAILVVSLYAGKFSGDMRWALQNRSFTLKSANTYVAQHTAAGDTIMGVWAGSLGWQSKAYILPVWDGYVNDKDIMQQFHPDVILSEVREEDSNEAFKSDGIILDTTQASRIKVGYWNICFYKIPQP